jgi:cyclophilin family peptidyl-prolyl cis-trans isomerase
VTAPATPWLDGAHTNFGKVVSGMEIVRQIEAAAVNANDHPLEDIVIENITLLK